MRAIDGDWLDEKVEARYRVTAGIERRCERDFLDLICAAPTLTPPNEPLTLEQLREMDGEPVWIVDIGCRKWYGPGWAIVDGENNLVRTEKNWNPVFFERYGESWLAYRRPPEGEAHAVIIL